MALIPIWQMRKGHRANKQVAESSTGLKELWRPELRVMAEGLNLIQNHFAYVAVKESLRIVLIYKTRRHVSRDLQR